MVSIVNDRLGDLFRLCERHRVRRLAVFGSAVRADFDPESSDLDFIVEFAPLEPPEHRDAYFGLVEDLGRLFSRSVDLIELEAVRSPVVKRRILESQETLYDAA